jgi:hypothetical protein
MPYYPGGISGEGDVRRRGIRPLSPRLRKHPGFAFEQIINPNLEEHPDLKPGQLTLEAGKSE